MPRDIIPSNEQVKLAKLVKKAKIHVDELREINRAKTPLETIITYFPFNLFFAQPITQVSKKKEKIVGKLATILEIIDENTLSRIVDLFNESLIADIQLLTQAYPEEYQASWKLLQIVLHISKIHDELIREEKVELVKALQSLDLFKIEQTITVIDQNLIIRKQAAQIVEQQIDTLQLSIASDNTDDLAKNQKFIEALKLLTELFPEKYSQHNSLLKKAEKVRFSKEAFLEAAISMQDLKIMVSTAKDRLGEVSKAKTLHAALHIIGDNETHELLTTVAKIHPKDFEDKFTLAQEAKKLLSSNDKQYLPEEEEHILYALRSMQVDKLSEAVKNANKAHAEREQKQSKLMSIKKQIKKTNNLDDILALLLGEFSDHVKFLSSAFPNKYNKELAIIDLASKISEETELLDNEKRSLTSALKKFSVEQAAKLFKKYKGNIIQRKEYDKVIANHLRIVLRQDNLEAMIETFNEESFLQACTHMAKAFEEDQNYDYAHFLQIPNELNKLNPYLKKMMNHDADKVINAVKTFEIEKIAKAVSSVIADINERDQALETYAQFLQQFEKSNTLHDFVSLASDQKFVSALKLLRYEYNQDEYENVSLLLGHLPQTQDIMSKLLDKEQSDLHSAFLSFNPNTVQVMLKDLKNQIARREEAKENIARVLGLIQQPKAKVMRPIIDRNNELRNDLQYLVSQNQNSDLSNTFADLLERSMPPAKLTYKEMKEAQVLNANQQSAHNGDSAQTSKSDTPKAVLI